MSSIGNISASNFLICDDNDIYFVGALNIIATLDVEHNFQHFPMIRDGLFPAYAIAKDTMSNGGVSEPVLAHAEELVDIFDDFEERYNNKDESDSSGDKTVTCSISEETVSILHDTKNKIVNARKKEKRYRYRECIVK